MEQLDHRAGTKTAQTVRDAWFRALRYVQFEDAIAATDHFFASVEARPRTFDLHPAMVKQFAVGRTAKQDYATFGTEAIACKECNDTGWLLVPLRGWLLEKAIAAYGDDRVKKLTQAINCSCERGRAINDKIARSRK